VDATRPYQRRHRRDSNLACSTIDGVDNCGYTKGSGVTPACRHVFLLDSSQRTLRLASSSLAACKIGLHLNAEPLISATPKHTTMDPTDQPPNTEAELESFRQKWREEVIARTKGKAPAASVTANTGTTSSKPRPNRSNAPDAATSSHARQRSLEDVDDVAPHLYHDLGDKQHGRRLDETSAETAAALAANSEPTSALEHYEKAVEKESEGRLGDSLSLYRKAFKVSVLELTTQ
jgi:hypothetical protein